MYAQQAQYLHSQGVLFMNKIKDFFYNKNDIIIVLIILIAAGLIIYTRIRDIPDPQGFHGRTDPEHHC